MMHEYIIHAKSADLNTIRDTETDFFFNLRTIFDKQVSWARMLAQESQRFGRKPECQ